MRRDAFRLLFGTFRLKPESYSNDKNTKIHLGIGIPVMYHIHYRSTRDPIVLDLSAVEDSEPERQEARRLLKEKRRAAKSNQENCPAHPSDPLQTRVPNAAQLECNIPSQEPLSDKASEGKCRISLP